MTKKHTVPEIMEVSESTGIPFATLTNTGFQRDHIQVSHRDRSEPMMSSMERFLALDHFLNDYGL